MGAGRVARRGRGRGRSGGGAGGGGGARVRRGRRARPERGGGGITPTRTCVVCRTRREDHALVRVGRRPDGTWYRGRGPGRGAWCCRDCAPGLSERALARALRGGPAGLDVAAAARLIGESAAVVEE
ncbi:MAG: hypothetical protein B7Z69_04655 [Actinobacteria bacterium 21-73-9]|nr:MAG: hypothetical protein B7Z69_04655 [Actinobacteria bacterium 21-73-9]